MKNELFNFLENFTLNMEIGKLDSKTTSTWNFVRDGMMLCQNRPYGGDNGANDAIFRTWVSGWIYNDFFTFSGLQNCWFMDGKRLIVKRNPWTDQNDISRDHLTFWLMWFKMKHGRYLLREYLNSIPWKFSDRFSMTIDFYLWTRMLAERKWAGFVFFPMMIVMMLFTLIWNKVIYYSFHLNKPYRTPLTGKQKKWSSRMYQTYALENLAWQLYFLKDHIGQVILRKILMGFTEKDNYVVRMLLKTGKFITYNQVESYKPMQGWRWGVRMDATNNRDMNELTDPELIKANVIDRDLLIKLYYLQ